MKEFIEEAVRYVQAGQSVLYANSPEESRLVAAIRKVGWLMASSADSSTPAVYPPSASAVAAKTEILEALKLAGVDHGIYGSTRRVDATLFIAALDALASAVPENKEHEARLENAVVALKEALDEVGYPTFVWNQVSGFEHNGRYADELIPALRAAGNEDDDALPARCLIVIKDAHTHINTNEGPKWRRALRNVAETNLLVSGKLSRHLFFIQPYFRPHPDVAHCFARLDFPRPDEAEINREISLVQQGIVNPAKRSCTTELRTELVRSLRGLDTANIAKALAVCVVENGGFVPEMVRRVRTMRARQLASGQGLRIIDPDDPELLMMGSLGGYENVRELIDQVILCRTPEAVAVGLRSPTGFGLAGPPGCLHPETPVHDPQNGTTKTVFERYEEGKPFTVTSFDEATGKFVQTIADAPHKYQPANMLRFTLGNGNHITVTHGHRFWTGEKYATAAEISSRVRNSEKAFLLTVYGSMQLLTGVTSVLRAEDVEAQPYYDFHVPGYENYVACGLVNHNTGKTCAAKLCANWMGVPLVQINMGTTKSSEGLYGVSEANMSNNLDTIRALGECVVLFDEWDKQAGGIVDSRVDNTGSGMLSMVLDFASDPKRKAFLIFTMNRLHGPLESLRSGRISRFFYTPLPEATDREEILTLKLREQDALVPADLSRVAADASMDGLTGSELAEMVNIACLTAFKRCGKKEPTVAELLAARQDVTPVTKLNREEVRAMADFEGIAVSVNKKKKKAFQQAPTGGARGIRLKPGNN